MGDVMGKAGRHVVADLLPRARAEFKPNVVLLNGENAAGGFGLTEKLYREFIDVHGVDCITMGNHWHDKREIYDYFPKAERLVIPANMSNVNTERMGMKILPINGTPYSFAVINVIGKVFMHGENRSFFDAIEKLLDQIPSACRVRVLDMHAEASSEKQAMAQEFAGRFSLIYGTHSHVPTADERLIGTTGFVTDLGMTGAYDSVIGMRKDAAIHRLKTGEKKNFEPATGDPWMCFVVADIQAATGACVGLTRHRWELAKFQ